MARVIHPLTLKIRQRACEKCKTQCDEYKSLELDHADPCACCPINVWPKYEGCQSETAIIEAIADPTIESPDASFSSQPGSLLKWAIWKATGIKACSTCSERSRQMDQWGWLGCWKERKTITDWLIHECKSRGHEVTRATARKLLGAAFRAFRFAPPKQADSSA